MDFIQIQQFASIDSQALTAEPPDREAPEDPSAQAKAKIIDIFPFWAAYITNFYVLPAGQAPRQNSVRPAFEPNRTERSAFAVTGRTEPKFGPGFGKKRLRTGPNRTSTSLARTGAMFAAQRPSLTRLRRPR